MASDLDGDGDQDVIATSFLGEPFYAAMRAEAGADAVVLFEQTARGRFTRHALEKQTCDYPTIAAGDLDGDGKPDLVAGRFRDFGFSGATSPGLPPAEGSNAPLVVRKNLGKTP